MAGLEGGLCSVLKEAAGSVSHLRLVAEVMAGLEGCLCSVLEEAAGSVNLTERAGRAVP